MTMKVLKAIKKAIVVCKGISLYPNKLDSHVFSHVSKNENPRLLLKSVFNPNFNLAEVELVFLGKYHVEHFEYYKKPKQDWVSFGEIIFTPKQALELGIMLIQIAKTVLDQSDVDSVFKRLNV